MTELGNRLKEAREEKGLTLDDVQNITKIQKRYLAGIEQGNYDIIPGKFYVRAFIKQYAEAVGIQPEILFDEYRHEIPGVYEETPTEELSRTQSRKDLPKPPSKFVEFLPKVVITAVVIGVVVLIWIFGKNLLANNDSASPAGEIVEGTDIDYEENGAPEDVNEPDENTGEEANDDGEEGNEETPAEPNAEEKVQEITVAQTSGNQTTYEVRNAEKFDVVIKSTPGGRSWIEAYSGNEQLAFQEVNDQNTKTLDLTGRESVLIKVGRSYETEILVNGTKLEYAIDNTVQDITIVFVNED